MKTLMIAMFAGALLVPIGGAADAGSIPTFDAPMPNLTIPNLAIPPSQSWEHAGETPWEYEAETVGELGRQGAGNLQRGLQQFGDGLSKWGAADRRAATPPAYTAQSTYRPFHGLPRACWSDWQSVCPGVASGGGRIINCLRERVAYVSDGCRPHLR